MRSPQRARRAADDSMRRAADHGSPPALHASVHNGARCGGLPTTARPLPCMQVPITALLAEGFPSFFPRSQGAPWWALACPPERRPSTLLLARAGSNLQPVGGDGADVPGCCESICTTSACPVAVTIVPASTPSSVHAHLRCCATREVTTATFRLHVIIQRGCSLGCSRRLPG